MRPVPSVLDLFSRRIAQSGTSAGRAGIERVLASVRVVLALSSLLLLRVDSSNPNPVGPGLLVFLFYLAHCLGILGILQGRKDLSAGFPFLLHVADVLWPAALGLLNTRVNPFPYFMFAIVAAALRWGMKETAITTAAVIAAWYGDARARAFMRIGPGEVSSESILLQSIYLMVFAFLVGYFAESEKRRAGEALSISQTFAKVRVEAGLKGTVQTVMGQLLTLFGGRELLVITREDSGQVMLWRAGKFSDSGDPVFTWRQLDESEQQEYLCVMGENIAGAVWRRSQSVSSLTLNAPGIRVYGQNCYLAARFVDEHRFETLLACIFLVAPGVSARILLFDPRLGGRPETQLRFLQEITSLVAPSVYNVYLLRRLRSRATAVERARVSRELHDGVVQSLHAIAFRLYALRTHAGVSPVEREQELLEVQQLVQSEASNVRDLIHQLEPLDFDPRHLVDFLAGMVTRYRQDTGIGAQFVCDVAEVSLPPATCREIAGILREALANVRRHSRAHNVLVRLGRQRGGWVLIIEDDGRGFEFAGRFTHAELDENRRGPLVIKQRVRAIEGELTIVSKPGQGARLEIRIPDFARASIA